MVVFSELGRLIYMPLAIDLCLGLISLLLSDGVGVAFIFEMRCNVCESSANGCGANLTLPFRAKSVSPVDGKETSDIVAFSKSVIS